MQNRLGKRRGLTLIETLLVLIVFLLAMILLQITASDCCGNGYTTMCAANLRGIGQAMYIYAQDDPQSFPAVAGRNEDGFMRIFDPQDRVTMQDVFSVPSPTVDMWTVVRAGNTLPEQFICPWTSDEPDPATFPSDFFDFLGPENLSYAYQFQHDLDKRIVSTSSDPRLPLLADSNPYIKGGVQEDFYADRFSDEAGNSTNHRLRQRGQNVVFQDGHVEEVSSPGVGLAGLADPALGSGLGRDHIYTVFEDLPGEFIDPGSAVPTEVSTDLGGRSDTCLVP